MDTQQQRQYKILVIGEECTDLYRYGKCERISSEAPVPIFLEENVEHRPGMAANVSKNIQALGHQTVLISNEEQIIKERIVHKKLGQQLLRIDKNDCCESLELSFIKDFLSKGDKYDATVISDYNKGFLSHALIREMIPLLPYPIFVDSKKRDLSSYEDCIIKINQLEYQSALKFPENYELIVTCGEKGARYKNIEFPVGKSEVKDICGAGDSFLSALVIKYLSTLDIHQAIQFANKCAGISVRIPGVYGPTWKEVMNNEICD